MGYGVMNIEIGDLQLNKCWFDEKLHQYRRTQDGPVLVGVTGTLKALGFIQPGRYTGQGRALGQHGHTAIRYLLDGTLDRSRLHPALAPRIAAYEKFCADTGFRALVWETPLAHPTHPYAGMFDQIGIDRESRYWLIDLKFGAVEPWAALQTAAYVGLLPPTPTGRPWKRAALQLPLDGTYNLIPFADPTDWPAYLGALSAYNWGRSRGYFRTED